MSCSLWWIEQISTYSLALLWVPCLSCQCLKKPSSRGRSTKLLSPIPVGLGFVYNPGGLWQWEGDFTSCKPCGDPSECLCCPRGFPGCQGVQGLVCPVKECPRGIPKVPVPGVAWEEMSYTLSHKGGCPTGSHTAVLFLFLMTNKWKKCCVTLATSGKCCEKL